MMVTPNETVAAIEKRAMQSILLTTKATGDDTMGFGKFASRTYADVAQTEVNYVTWCCQTAREGDCSVYLRRFVNWIEKEKPPLGENDRKKNGGNPLERRSEFEALPPTSMDEHATSSTTSLIKELTGTVAKLAREVQELKDNQQEPPRKTASKPKPNQDCRSVGLLLAFLIIRPVLLFPICSRDLSNLDVLSFWR